MGNITHLAAEIYSDCAICGDSCYCDIPENPPPCWFDWGLELLYWKPCVDDLDFAIKTKSEKPNQSTGKYLNVCLNSEAGVRARISRDDLFCGWGLQASYAFIYTEDKTKTDVNINPIVDNPTDKKKEEEKKEEKKVPYNRFSTLLHPKLFEDPWDSISGKYSIHYHAWDAMVMHQLDYYRCHLFTPFAGVSGVFLDQQFKSKLKIYKENKDGKKSPTIQDKGFVKWDSDLIGVGLKFGAEYLFKVDSSLSLFSKASFEILASHVNTLNKQQVRLDVQSKDPIISGMQFRDPDCWRLVDGCHFQLGAIYAHDVFGCGSVLRFGYEFVKYYNVPNPRRFFQFQDAESQNSDEMMSRSTPTNTSTLGFHGIFIGMDVKF